MRRPRGGRLRRMRGGALDDRGACAGGSCPRPSAAPAAATSAAPSSLRAASCGSALALRPCDEPRSLAAIDVAGGLASCQDRGIGIGGRGPAAIPGAEGEPVFPRAGRIPGVFVRDSGPADLG